MKNILEGVNSRLNDTQAGISKMEDNGDFWTKERYNLFQVFKMQLSIKSVIL